MDSDTPLSQSQNEPSSILSRNRELAVLYAIGSYLNRNVDVHEVLQEILIQVTRLLDMQTGWVWLLNEHRQIELAASQALPPYLANHPERLWGSCLCLDTFLAGDLEGASNIDVLRCSRLKSAERDSDPTSWGLRYHASVPIYAGSVALGVLNVASRDWRELSQEDLQLLHIIADQIGLAMQRARLSEEQTRSAARLATIEERNRLAREIHDTLAQGLAAITLQLETADVLIETKPLRAQEATRRALGLARDNLEEARRSVMDLRAVPLQGYTLPEALETLARKMQEQDESVEIQFRFQTTQVPPIIPSLSPRLETGLYRIAQEALTNASRHAQATQIRLTLKLDQTGLQLMLQDDGRGFDPETIEQRVREGHFGLAGMSERVRLMGGCLFIGSEPGTGTYIHVSIPYRSF